MVGQERHPSTRSSAPSGYTQVYRNLFRDDYVKMQYTFVEFFTQHILDIAQVFKGDFQLMLVLAVMGQAQLKARMRAGVHASDEIPPDLRPLTYVNATSVAEITGIPRETVRRKLKALAKRGWIAQDKPGLWRIAADGASLTPVRRDLADLHQRGIERIVRLFGDVHAMAVQAGTQVQQEPE